MVVAVALAGVGLTRPTSATSSVDDRVYTAHYDNVLGTSFEMKTLAASESDSEKAEAAALAEIDREA
jgi:hypothetical protein